MNISDTTRELLSKVTILTAPTYIVQLPPVTLSRSEYEDVNKVFVKLGGKWDRKAKGHVFDHDPTDEIQNAISTGTVTDLKKELQFFPTPRPLAQKVCKMACINEDSVVLEPSCGNGAIADVAWEYHPKALVGIEINPNMAQYLKDKPYETVVGKDFLQYYQPNVFDRIVMNPPFSKHQDIEHVHHAYTMLKPGGILVSIIGISSTFRDDAKSEAFRQFLIITGAEIASVEKGAFKESGTMVETCIIKICKPLT